MDGVTSRTAQHMGLFITKTLLSGLIIAAVSELARRNNTAAAIIHSLPLTSLLAFIWLYGQSADTALIARHAEGTFWYVLPTLPLFLILPALLRHGWTFWPALGTCILITVGLYYATMQLLRAMGVQI
jgi:hypothetical protein